MGQNSRIKKREAKYAKYEQLKIAIPRNLSRMLRPMDVVCPNTAALLVALYYSPFSIGPCLSGPASLTEWTLSGNTSENTGFGLPLKQGPKVHANSRINYGSYVKYAGGHGPFPYLSAGQICPISQNGKEKSITE